jgi:drug/metabolite transporter (DMT)-like permease
LGCRAHGFIVLQGVLLFGVNYWLVYLAELELPSGLVAVVFSSILFANVLNGRVFLGSRVQGRVLLGGLLGIVGIGSIFLRELLAFDAQSQGLRALGLAIVSVYLASLGNILSARNQRAGLGVVQTNTFGMLYGGTSMLALSMTLGRPLDFDLSFRYVASLAYLAVFGSIVAFACFLTLIGRIGADRAAYVAFMMPIIALALTTLVEGYVWTAPALLGVVLVLAGNYLALRT